MAESQTQGPDDQAEFSPVLPDAGEALPPAPENFAEAKALKKFQDGQGMEGATEAFLAQTRAEQAKRLEDARTALKEAEDDPNIISGVPWSTEAVPDAAPTANANSDIITEVPGATEAAHATDTVKIDPPIITEVPGFAAPESDTTDK